MSQRVGELLSSLVVDEKESVRVNDSGTAWEVFAPMDCAVYDSNNDGIVDKARIVSITARNTTGSTITKGSIVYVSGASGNHVLITLADKNSESTSSKTLGMVIADIAHNADGVVAVNGTVDDLDTNAYAPGTGLYLGDNGGWTSTPPTQPAHSVFIGWVTIQSSTGGRVVLHIQNGYELNELHNVLISGVTDKNILYYDTATALWKNGTAILRLSGTKTEFDTACSDDNFAYLGQANSFTSTNKFTTIGLESTAATATSSLIVSKNVSGTAYGLNLTYNQTSSGSLYPIYITGRANASGANGNLYGAVIDLNNINGANLTSTTGSLITTASTATSTVTTMSGIVVSSVAQSTTTTHRGLEVGVTNGSSSTVTNTHALRGTWTGGGSGGTSTNVYGLRLDGWAKNSGSVTTSYGIYMDTSIGVGTTAYGIYSTLDKASYHVGKLGIGTNTSSPAARLEIRDTTEQVRIGYDTNNFTKFTVGSDGTLTIQALSTNGATAAIVNFSNTYTQFSTGGAISTQGTWLPYSDGNNYLSATSTIIRDSTNTTFLTLASTATTFIDGNNLAFGTSTGTKIGTATSQKLAFYNATPIVQPTTGVAAGTFVANSGTAVNDASTFDGYTLKQIVKALRNLGLLA